MVNPKAVRNLLLAIIFLVALSFSNQVWAGDDLSAQVKKRVSLLNVGLKIRLANSYWVHVSDLSSQKKFYVFTTTSEDCGYQIINHGSAFTVAQKAGHIFFATNEHVIHEARIVEAECQMFYAAALLYAEKNLKGKNSFVQVLQLLNANSRPNLSKAERASYQDTVNKIWDCYDANLAPARDPAGAKFEKYKRLAKLTFETKLFVHLPGMLRQSSLEASVYKQDAKADLALIACSVPELFKKNAALIPFNMDNRIFLNQSVYIAGYPISAAPQILGASFSNGIISNIRDKDFEFDGFVTPGYSGSPVINSEGKVVGIVAQRLAINGVLSSSRGRAIRINQLESLAPDLFEISKRQKKAS